jgi:hypothetical protein
MLLIYKLILMVIHSCFLLFFWMRRKLTARKHLRAPPRRDAVPPESHSDGQSAGYFLRTFWMLLLSLGYGEPQLIIGTPRLLWGNTYLWHM